MRTDAQDIVLNIMTDLSCHQATSICISNIRCTLDLPFLGPHGCSIAKFKVNDVFAGWYFHLMMDVHEYQACEPLLSYSRPHCWDDIIHCSLVHIHTLLPAMCMRFSTKWTYLESDGIACSFAMRLRRSRKVPGCAPRFGSSPLPPRARHWWPGYTGWSMRDAFLNLPVLLATRSRSSVRWPWMVCWGVSCIVSTHLLLSGSLHDILGWHDVLVLQTPLSS